jgi:hypothetical protein
MCSPQQTSLPSVHGIASRVLRAPTWTLDPALLGRPNTVVGNFSVGERPNKVVGIIAAEFVSRRIGHGTSEEHVKVVGERANYISD